MLVSNHRQTRFSVKYYDQQRPLSCSTAEQLLEFWKSIFVSDLKDWLTYWYCEVVQVEGERVLNKR